MPISASPATIFARQIARWSAQYAASTGPRFAALDRLVDWLPANMPEDDGAVSIAHGDYRVGNLMWHPAEPRVTAVLDWELSTLGHPLADLGFCVIPLAQRTGRNTAGSGAPTGARAGIPDRDTFVAEYHAHARPPHPPGPLLPFHIAFALFRFAVIFVGNRRPGARGIGRRRRRRSPGATG